MTNLEEIWCTDRGSFVLGKKRRSWSSLQLWDNSDLLQMPSVGTLGSTLPSGPKSLKVKHQTFPHNGSTGLKRPVPASPPVIDSHQGAGAKGATGCGMYIQESLGWCRSFLLCPDLLPFCVIQEKKNYKKSHLSTWLLGWTNIFPPVSGGPWESYFCIGKRSFPAFKILQLL